LDAAGLDWPEPSEGSQFNDIGLMCDAAAAGMGVARCGSSWAPLAGQRHAGAPVRPGAQPHAHYLCWRTGTMDRWECAAFAEWLSKAI
jgi:DNA-binding transcriptional LysR family regulator